MKIELKNWSEAYFEEIADIFTRCDRSFLSDGLPMPYTQAHARGWYESAVQPNDGSRGIYRIIFADEKPAGVISLACGSDVYAHDAEIGYLLLREYSGMDVMTQAVDLACAEAFAKLDILRITAKVFSENIASLRILEKNGFQKEGCMRQAVCKNGKAFDLLIFGKLRPQMDKLQ